MNEIKAAQSTPDQLEKMLDLQLAQARSQRAQPAGGKRTAILVFGVLFILGACGAALLILQQMLSDLPRP